MDRIITAIVQILRTAVDADGSPLAWVKGVFRGDPIKIPDSYQPAITVQPIETVYRPRWRVKMEKVHIIEIRLVYNAKDFFWHQNTDPLLVKAVQDGIAKTEPTDIDHATEQNTVCGVISSNIRLEYDDGGTTRHACEKASVERVNYVLSSQRPFDTYEIVVTVEAIAIGDRS